MKNNNIQNVMSQAVELLQVDLRNPPSESEIISRLGISEYHFRQGFRKFFGTTIGAFLRKKRMTRASEMLADTDMPISQVAEEVGFRNSSRFAEAFRNQFGSNPLKYRKSQS